MKGQLNHFQKSMLQWNDWHPYNAVHVVRVPGALDYERLKRAITTTLEGKGLTGLALNRCAGTYQYHGGTASLEIKLATVGATSSGSLAEEIERQLNTPFTLNSPFSPFRFFVVSEGDSFSLGLVYFHALADAACILVLLKDTVETYRGRGSPGLASPVECHPPRRDRLLRHHPGVLVRRMIALPSLIRNLRSACRPPDQEVNDLTNKFVYFTLRPRVLSCLAQAAKSWKVTLNDVFLALLMKAVSLLVPDRTQAARRNEILLGCIVNIRKDLGMDGRRVFGLFLGSFVVHHAVPAGITLADLARDLGRQTLGIKQKRLYLGTGLELSLGRLMISMYSAPRRRKLYRKHYPLWGGLTNMNLNSLWPQPEETRPIDYFRAVSTGPVTPLVFSVTTVGEVANIGLTYRPSVFSAPEIEQIQDCWQDPLAHLADGP